MCSSVKVKVLSGMVFVKLSSVYVFFSWLLTQIGRHWHLEVKRGIDLMETLYVPMGWTYALGFTPRSLRPAVISRRFH